MLQLLSIKKIFLNSFNKLTQTQIYYLKSGVLLDCVSLIHRVASPNQLIIYLRPQLEDAPFDYIRSIYIK